MSSNDGSHLALARALALRRETTIDPESDLTLWVDRAQRAGHDYSDRPPGTAFAALPAVWLGARLDPVLAVRSRETREILVLPAGANYARTHALRGRRSPALLDLQGTSLLLRLHTAGVGILGLWAVCGLLALRAVGARTQAVVVAILGACTLWGPYATVLFGHVTTTTAVALTQLALERGERARDRAIWPLLSGASAAWAVAADYLIALVIVPLLLASASRLRLRGGVQVMLGSAPVVLATLAYHRAAFGSPWSIGYDSQSNFAFAKTLTGTFDGNFLEGLWTLLGTGRGAGLVALSPVVVLGLAMALRHEARRVWLVWLPWLAVLALHHTPWGGGTGDHRYLLPLLPLSGLGLGHALGAPSRAMSSAVAGLAVLSGVLGWGHFFGWRDG